MNVLNVPDIERELSLYAARTRHPSAKKWVMTVARNHILGTKLSNKDMQANFLELSTNPALGTATVPLNGFVYFGPNELPAWAVRALEQRDTVYWFDPIQPRRRELWQMLEIVLFWFNSWKPEDTRLRRLDRISFPVAMQAAVLWRKDVTENVWNYISDKPVVLKEYENGFRWVKLVSALQFEREGAKMGHCVGNGGYYNRWRADQCAEYMSLRDKHNNPHATMEVTYEHSHPTLRKGKVIQCKGKQNSKPVKEYQPYIRRFINDMKFEIGGDAHHID